MVELEHPRFPRRCWTLLSPWVFLVVECGIRKPCYESFSNSRFELLGRQAASTASLLLLPGAFLFSETLAARPELPEPLLFRAGWQLQEAGKVRETAEAISRSDYEPSGWYKATVPGTVLTTLVNEGVYPDPLYGENNRPDKIPDSLCRTSYWYRTTFTPPASCSGKRVWLTFKGINYIAEVWVNGRQVGTIQGAFARGVFDVTPNVSVGKPNGLAVHVFPQPHPGATHEKTVATGTGPNGGVTGLDGPTFLCSIGWDWIPTIRDRDTGLWQDVVLSASGPVVLPDPAITSDLPLPRTDTADLTVQATVRNVTDSAQSGVLAGTIERIRFKEDVSLAPHETRVITFSPQTTPALRVKNPRLWWPNGYGPQNLYRLHLSFLVAGAVSDARDVSFGIRKITYTLPGSDNLALSVNGVPVVAKGGDWGLDEAMKRIPRGRLDAMIRMHQLANYTIIRNWVGQSTSDDLYDLCDQYGLLLWDEFFEPYPGDGPIPENVPLYLANVREKILHYRNHPSIALWCARNEGDPPPSVARAPQGDGGMIPVVENLLPHIGEGQKDVLRNRAVAGIGLEELVPQQQTILVAQIIQIVAGALADPIADDGVVGELVHANHGVQPPARDAFHRLVEAPVAPFRDDRDAVDGQRQVVRARQGVGNLANAERNVARVGNRARDQEAQVQAVEVLGPVAIRPPEPRVLDAQSGRGLRAEGDNARLMRSQGDVFFEVDALDGAGQNTGLGAIGYVADGRLDGQVGGIGARQRQVRGDGWVRQDDRATGRQDHVLPEAGIAVANGGDPVPADAAQEGWPIQASHTAVGAGAGGDGLFVGSPGMRLRKDVHGQAIRFAHRHIGGHIKDAPRKGALDGPHLAAIDPHLGDVVDPFERQPHTFAGAGRGRRESGAIPIRSAAERVGYLVGAVILTVEWIRIDAFVNQGGQHSARNGGLVPTARLIVAAGDRLGGLPDFAGFLELPARPEQEGLGQLWPGRQRFRE